MPIPTPLTLLGAPGSPYTRKMVALLRYRRIPVSSAASDVMATRADCRKPKVALLPTFYLPDANGALEAVVDSTPLIRRFESAIQRTHGDADGSRCRDFIDYLLEDYADEWLTKAMFHYRWYYAADIERAGEILPRWTAVTAAEEQMQKIEAIHSTAPDRAPLRRRLQRHHCARDRSELSAFPHALHPPARTAAVRDGRPSRRGRLRPVRSADPTRAVRSDADGTDTRRSTARVRVGRHRRRLVGYRT